MLQLWQSGSLECRLPGETVKLAALDGRRRRLRANSHPLKVTAKEPPADKEKLGCIRELPAYEYLPKGNLNDDQTPGLRIVRGSATSRTTRTGWKTDCTPREALSTVRDILGEVLCLQRVSECKLLGEPQQAAECQSFEL